MSTEKRFGGLRHTDWCVVANLVCVALVSAVVTGAVWHFFALRWYWLLLVFFFSVWLASYIAERFPVGTFIVERVSHDDTTA